MKQLTSYAVELVMNLLIHSNGETTTLDVKNHLRQLNYFAEQADVSVKMREIVLQNPDEYETENTGKYFIYTFNESGDLMFNYSLAKNIDDSDDEDDDSDSQDLRNPKMILYTTDHIQSNVDCGNIDIDDWFVSCTDDNESYLIFSGSLNRDTVRSRYSSINKVSIQTTRAKRISKFL